MSHEISIRSTGFAEMAFAGKLPWHGLGQRVDPNATIAEWRTQAGLDWQVNTATVEYAAADSLRSFDDKRVLYRSDTQAPLSVVSDGYRIVQPEQVLEFFRDLTEAHGFHIHTAGVLKGGRKIWALAKNGHIEEAAPGDKLRGNLLLATSCDGTMQTVAQWTAVRVVCANTLAIAMANGRNAVRTSHRTTFQPDEVKVEMGALDKAFYDFAKQAQTLAAKPFGVEQARAILKELFKQPARIAETSVASYSKDYNADIQASAKIVKEHRTIGKVIDLFNGAGMGAQHAGSKGTAWGFVNAVSEYIDHHAGRSDDTRIDTAWFGKGAQIKQEAIDRAIAA